MQRKKIIMTCLPFFILFT